MPREQRNRSSFRNRIVPESWASHMYHDDGSAPGQSQPQGSFGRGGGGFWSTTGRASAAACCFLPGRPQTLGNKRKRKRAGIRRPPEAMHRCKSDSYKKMMNYLDYLIILIHFLRIVIFYEYFASAGTDLLPLPLSRAPEILNQIGKSLEAVKSMTTRFWTGLECTVQFRLYAT